MINQSFHFTSSISFCLPDRLDALGNTSKALREWNINGKHLLWVEVRSIGKEDENAAHSHRSCGHQGVLLCYENIKE